MAPRRNTGRRLRLQRIERAIDLYLEACYRQRTAAKVKELAALLRQSRPYVSRVVGEVSDVTLTDMMRKKQAAHAETLLRHTQLPVGEVASRSAFGDVKTLYRAFAKWYGMRPGAYRKGLPNAHGRHRS